MRPTGLDRALQALGPYLDDLVLCGAWAWYLYRRLLGPPKWMPAEFTRDLDCIGRERLPVRDAAVLDRLKESGFVWVPRGEETPAVARFAWPDARKPDVELEFLVPARGDRARRVVELQPGLPAQALGDLDVLLDSPLHLAIDEAGPLASDLSFRGVVRVPRTGHFVVQKALIHQRRSREEQVKDVFYVLDLIDSENGLADIVLSDLASAEARWGGEVARFAQVMERRLGEPRFLIAVSEQLPPERRPSVTYVEREMRTWLARLSDTRARLQSIPNSR